MKKVNVIYYMFTIVGTAIMGWVLTYKQLLLEHSIFFLGVFFIISLFIAHELSIIIHETGHLCFGLWTGYGFVSYRYRSFLVKKNSEGNLSWHRFGITGTGGQCLMSPPTGENVPLYLYNAGGVIFNTLQAFIAVMIALLLPKGSVLSLFLMVLGFLGLFLGFLNWMDAKGLSNDGRNHRDAKASTRSKEALFLVLSINTKLSEGTLLSTIDFGERQYTDYDTNVSIEFNVVAFMSDQAFNNLDFETGLLMLDVLMGTPLHNNYDLLVKLEYYLRLMMVDVEGAKSFYTSYRQDIEMARNLSKTQCTYELVSLFEGVYLHREYDESLMQKYLDKRSKHPLPGLVNDDVKWMELFVEAVAEISN